jgi:hypothetical protein
VFKSSSCLPPIYDYLLEVLVSEDCARQCSQIELQGTWISSTAHNIMNAYFGVEWR